MKEGDRRLFRKYCYLAARENRKEGARGFVIAPFLILPGIGLTLTPFALADITSAAAWVQAIVITPSICILYQYLRLLIFRKRRSPLFALSLTLAATGAIIGLTQGKFYPHAAPECGVAEAVSFACIFCLTTIISLSMTFAVTMRTISAVLDFSRLHYYPDVVLFAELQLLTHMLTGHSDSLRSLDARREMIERLHRAAECLEHGIPKILDMKDSPYRERLQQQVSLSACRLRSAELLLALPDDSTREALLREFAGAIVPVIRRQYGEIPIGHASESGKKSVKNTAVTYTGKALSGLVPIGMLWALHLSDVSVSGTFSNALYILAFGWAVITFVSMLDPLYAGRVQALKDVVGSISSIKK
ncbi:hypothetical protein OG780_43315 [Streptomyces sp. NBC_00386]|uniref:hypothetical protein n=1 Tax=Streptomyces sp. NBC_00386 TaxID=2975734 RepID=UPI002E2013FE